MIPPITQDTKFFKGRRSNILYLWPGKSVIYEYKGGGFDLRTRRISVKNFKQIIAEGFVEEISHKEYLIEIL